MEIENRICKQHVQTFTTQKKKEARSIEKVNSNLEPGRLKGQGIRRRYRPFRLDMKRNKLRKNNRRDEDKSNKSNKVKETLKLRGDKS